MPHHCWVHSDAGGGDVTTSTPFPAAVEGPGPLPVGLKYGKLGAADGCAETEQGVHTESEAGKGIPDKGISRHRLRGLFLGKEGSVPGPRPIPT